MEQQSKRLQDRWPLKFINNKPFAYWSKAERWVHSEMRNGIYDDEKGVWVGPAKCPFTEKHVELIENLKQKYLKLWTVTNQELREHKQDCDPLNSMELINWIPEDIN
jgi:hypothetical protein